MKENFSSLAEGDAPREREREREDSSLIHKKVASGDKTIPEGWVPLAEEYVITEADQANGLSDFLYSARDYAADTLADFLSGLGSGLSKLPYLKNIPIGLEEDSDTSGLYDPGIYGIVIGRDSEEITDFLDGENPEKAKHRVARTMIHEMIHVLQTTKHPYQENCYATVGNTVMGWRGLEEGIAEAIANIAVKMKTKHLALNEAAKDLETVTNKVGMPATEMSAKLIQKLKPTELAWYLSAGDQDVRPGNDKFADLLGDNYLTFCKNMAILLDAEEDKSSLSATQIAQYAEETRNIIDQIDR